MKIKHIKEVTPRTVYAIQTSTSTFIADGLAHHNCGYCNCKPPFGLNGNLINYTLFMLSEGYTQDEIADFQRLKGTTKVYKEYHFRELKELYDNKTKVLIEEYKDKIKKFSTGSKV